MAPAVRTNFMAGRLFLSSDAPLPSYTASGVIMVQYGRVKPKPRRRASAGLSYHPRDARNAARVCPARKTYPNSRAGTYLTILGLITLFLFAPVWVWVIVIGVALILIGFHFMGKE
ncbi:MAG: hypothetical protein LBS11_12015 [Oscillospiraceae bacterium]|nr:hypothetical protein [Oscillospiraceae bacterium]